MLRLYAGRESVDKERFIYENITGEALIIVPDQYTLVAEEQALRYMDTDCLFEVEIMSMNRLGLRLLEEQGEESLRMLDKYGRFMLLAKLVKEHKDDFVIFRNSATKLTFVNMLSDFISKFKQQNCTLEELSSLLEGDANGDSVQENLKEKLSELRGIITAYEDAISGRYTDSEDYIAKYVSLISQSEYVRGKNIWIYCYDTITPKFATAILELTKVANDVSFIVNRNDFGLDEQLIRMLSSLCQEAGLEISCTEIPSEYLAKKSETIRRIEKDLWQINNDNKEFLPEDLTLTSCANPYYEAENAAIYVWHLIRDLGYRMNEIQLIVNDEEVLHPIIKRVFTEYGLPLFKDASRRITDSAPVAFIVNLLLFICKNQPSDKLFAMLKTGLTDALDERIENLENYVRTYHIRGGMWNKSFKYGMTELGSEMFQDVEDLRADIMSRINPLKELVASREKMTVRMFADSFKSYLEKTWLLGLASESLARSQEHEGYNDDAQRTLLSYEYALQILDQLVEILGEEELDIDEFADIYITGLLNVEVGVIPSAIDGLSIGTLIRTRPRPVRAVVILGANEGTLPLSPSTAGLFSVDEKEYFKKKGFALGYLDDLKMSEENAAMYRLLSKASEKLYVSWSMTNIEGDEAQPSTLIDLLKGVFPLIEKDHLVAQDAISRGWGGDHLVRQDEALRHLMIRIKDRNAPSQPDALMEAMLQWYKENETEELDVMLAAAADENDPRPLGPRLASELYIGERSALKLSASAIDGYIKCPFKYFIDRGLKPEEERSFSSDRRSIGDLYHNCLVAIAEKVFGDEALIQELLDDDEALAKVIGNILDSIITDYREGVFISTGNEEYRTSRVQEVIFGVAKAMLKQFASETLVEAVFEESFGRYGRFKPISFKVGDQDVIVEGRIDRADVISVGNEERIRVIDYKTGQDSLNMWKMRHGYKMQLMIYMMSTLGEYKPAGMFYFNIADKILSAEKEAAKKSELEEEKDASEYFTLKGAYVDESGVLQAMPPSVLGIATKKDGSLSSVNNNPLTIEAFEEARSDVMSNIEKAARDILDGEIHIKPLMEGRLACMYCKYKPICKRDKENYKNLARMIPKEPKAPKNT